MQNNTAVQFAPFVGDEKRVDMAIENGEAVIQLSTWTDGLGWCTQKTMRLESALLDDLHRAIAAARVRLRSDNSGNDATHAAAKVLDFPAIG